jgi:hypothetical protein
VQIRPLIATAAAVLTTAALIATPQIAHADAVNLAPFGVATATSS